MLSIDQNCHPLWDALPKLRALAAAGREVTHCIEDIDVAFTQLGADPDQPLSLALERFYRSGGQDWGAALFYSEFLGKLPVEIREWETCTGRTTKALAKQLALSVDELYDEFSPGDNWQLIGPSYVGDKHHHRVIGDVTVAEAGPFLREMMDKAEADCRTRLPDPGPQERIAAWFAAERERLGGLLTRFADARLVDLYRGWMSEHLDGAAALAMTGELLGLSDGGLRMLALFTRNYDTAAGLYNEALAETDVGLRPLETKRGELPFFATMQREDRLVRTGVFLEAGALRCGDRTVPLRDGACDADALRAAGIRAVAGKAVVLVIQVRLGNPGRGLALPYRGSLYMPAVHCFARKLQRAGLIDAELRPVVRVRFHLLDRLTELETTLKLPDHLAREFDAETIPAARLGREWRNRQAGASERLERFGDEEQREAWQKEAFAETFDEMAELARRRRALAEEDPKCPEIRELSHRRRDLERRIARGTLRQVADDWQLARIDTWDSRGAIEPWSLFLGGRDFAERVVGEAEIYEE